MIFYRFYSEVIHNPDSPTRHPAFSAFLSRSVAPLIHPGRFARFLVLSPEGLARILPEMRTADFDFELPAELIAQAPAGQRDASRLFILEREGARFEHRVFGELAGCLRPGDVLVLNNSRVIAARLRGRNAKSGGQFEILLLEAVGLNEWWVMLRPGKRGRIGTVIELLDSKGHWTGIQATVLAKNAAGHCRLQFSGVANLLAVLDQFGQVPLPPYIERSGATSLPLDRERYQTVFAEPPGSVAAPTAGLHFTEPLLEHIRDSGVEICFVTLHVGAGTFAPVKSQRLEEHIMHEERYELSEQTAGTIRRAKARGGRVVAVGTTTVRVLETVAERAAGVVNAGWGRTRIFIHPPYRFRIVDALLTNFHLPRSTLLMLVSAFAAPGATSGRDLVLSAYAEAIRQRYRFYSYGDAMLLL